MYDGLDPARLRCVLKTTKGMPLTLGALYTQVGTMLGVDLRMCATPVPSVHIPEGIGPLLLAQLDILFLSRVSLDYHHWQFAAERCIVTHLQLTMVIDAGCVQWSLLWKQRALHPLRM